MNKKTIRKIKIIVTAFIMIIISTISSFACTGSYVGKNVSESGAIIIGRTRDSNNLNCVSRRTVVDGVKNKPGRIYKEINGFEMELPDTTFRYLSGPLTTSSGRGTFGASCANEKGLAITATVTAATRKAALGADPFIPTGISEACIGDIVASCCSTAREGVEFLGKVISEHGNAEPNTIMIADSDEAWYIETYTGYQWAAIKMPDDKVSVFANEFMLDPLNEDYEEIIYSPDFFTMPKEHNIAVYDKNGNFDLFMTYIGEENISEYSNTRVWYGHHLFDRNDVGDYVSKQKYKLFFEPNKKIGVADLAELDRSRYEGTSLCPDIDGREDRRIIGTETQYSVDITEVYDNIPKEMSVISWVCLDNAEHSVFLPYSNLLTETSDAYSRNVEEGFPYEDDSIAFYAFQNLCTLSVTGRDSYGQGVRKYWKGVENYLMDSYPEIIKRTAAIFNKDKNAAAQYITDYSKYIQDTAVSDARQMTKDLFHYLALNQRTFDFKIKAESGSEYEKIQHETFTASMEGTQSEKYSITASGVKEPDTDASDVFEKIRLWFDQIMKKLL